MDGRMVVRMSPTDRVADGRKDGRQNVPYRLGRRGWTEGWSSECPRHAGQRTDGKMVVRMSPTEAEYYIVIL